MAQTANTQHIAKQRRRVGRRNGMHEERARRRLPFSSQQYAAVIIGIEAQEAAAGGSAGDAGGPS